MIELERTYLARRFPEGLLDSPRRVMLDVYLPADSRHPVLRLRRNGDTMEMTKKTMVEGADSSKMEEQTIRLSPDEYAALVTVDGKRVGKTRYLYEFQGRTAEVDVFDGALSGLVLVDFEFETEAEKDAFSMPEFCLAEVTQEEFIAGGFLAGKSYADIAPGLARFGYTRIDME